METTGGKVDRSADAILEDCQNAAALDTLFKQEMEVQVEDFARHLEIHASSPPQLQWKTGVAISSSELVPSVAQPLDTNVHLA